MTSSASPPMSALPEHGAVMGKARRENFTVASAVLGPRRRRHLLAIYGFARLVDDVGDEVDGDRSALLDVVEGELDRIYAGEPCSHPAMRELAATVSDCRVPDEPFRRLIEANRQDQRVTRYETFDDLLAYCQLSAAPVGELVLHVFEVATPERVAMSDKVCAGLQITEHLQDLGEDHRRGRVYMPAEDLSRFGCEQDDFSGPASPARDALIRFEAARVRALFREGAPLTRTLSVRPRIAVAGFIAGGRAALGALDGAPEGGAARRPRRGAKFAGAFAQAIVGR